MSAPQTVLDLVARFEQQRDAYKSGQYNETQLRREFLDPLFQALGWDVDNVQGYAEAYKDVIHEDQIRGGGATKAPDYGFRIGGTRKFFLEAKKPSVCIKDEPSPAYQLRRYAWSAKLPLSILSDFEEFAVYDCRIKPHQDDPAATARIFYCTFRELGEKWDWIASAFSREAVLKGSFDKFAESSKGKRGTTAVDDAFLEPIEGWRKRLAENRALRNPKLSQRELNFAVQRIIDRIIFLRIGEDRGIEDYGRLRALVNGDRINVLDWQAEFPQIFRRATSSGELRETPAAPLDYTRPGVPLPGSDGSKKRKGEKARPLSPAIGPEWEGGFDAVIGNPPCVRIQTMQDSQPQEVEYFNHPYTAASQGNYDIYVVFAECGLGLLAKAGRLGFILPNKFFNAQYGQALREILSAGKHLVHIVHFGDQQVFSKATTYTCLLFLGKTASRVCDVIKVASLDAWRRSGTGERAKLQANSFGAAEWNIEVGAQGALRSRLPKPGKPLGEVARLFVGLQTSADRVFVLKSRGQVEPTILRPFLTTGGLRPYQNAEVQSWIVFPYEIDEGQATLIPSERMRREFPKTWAYLRTHEDALRKRDRGKWDHDQWYAFGRSQNLTEMDEEKLVIQVTAINPTVILDSVGLFMTGGGAGPFYGIRPLPSAKSDIKFLLGILNSKVFGWIVRTQSTPLRGGYFKFSKQYIETAPIPQPDKVAHDRMVKLVEQMLALHRQLATARTPQEKTALERQIAATATQIDRLVYDLYGLNTQEIGIVEGASQ